MTRHELELSMATAALWELRLLRLEAKESARVKCERGGVMGERCGMKCHAEAQRGLDSQSNGDARPPLPPRGSQRLRPVGH